MGIRSFLIRFESIYDIKMFLKYRKYLAYQIMICYENNKEINPIDIFDTDKVDNFNNNSNMVSESYGDFDIDLVGLKFWAGSIWGLVSTYSVGESTFIIYVTHFKNYHTRLWNIPMQEVVYKEIDPIIFASYNDLEQASSAFKKLYDQYFTKIIDYKLMFNTHSNIIECDPDGSIDFHNKNIQNLFGVESKIKNNKK